LLSGVALAGLWLVVLVLAMAETALTYASRAKLEENLERSSLQGRYIRYLDRSGPAKAFCVLARVCAIAGFIVILSGQITSPLVYLYAAAPLAVAEIGGRLLGKHLSTGVLIVLLPPLQIAWWVTWPFRSVAGNNHDSPAGEPDEHVVDAAMEEIRVAIEDAATEGAIHAEEKEMIEGVLEFEDVEVSEIMTPRTDVECIEVNTPLNKAIQMVGEFHHSRIPIYEGVREKLVGIVHLKDILGAAARPNADELSLRDVMQKPFFVPETKHALSLLRDFKQHRAQVAVILDEYGGVAGLVTLEDVMEEIVGDIEDEFDEENAESRIRRLGPGTLDVDARTRVDEINELLPIDLPEDEDYDTVGGFVMQRFASVPKKGQEMRHNGVLFRVLDANDRRVLRVLLQRLEPDKDNERG